MEELLSEEETIGECKNQNAKLLEFLTKPENLKKLVHYATRVPEDPSNHDQSKKYTDFIKINSRYPFVATDILVSSMRIAESFIKIKEI